LGGGGFVMPKPRAYWKGFLRLSLVSIPVSVYNAVDSSSEIAFRQIHKPSGRRVNYEKTVPGVGKIENADIVKGYEIDKDKYVTIDPEELESIKLESKQTIDLVQFVDARDIDYRYFERPYFLVPTNDIAGEGYVVIRDALTKTGKVGLAQITIGGREWLVAVAPLETGLVMELLRYANELKETDAFFEEIPTVKPAKEMIDLAVQLIEQKAGKFEPTKFEDHYATALKNLVHDKMKGKAIISSPEAARPTGANVVDLMAALKRSLGQPDKGSPSKAAKSAKPKVKKTRRS
jgi:DNA end-binding protein Ku